MPRERALACAVRLLDLGFFRIGGEDYAEDERELRAGDDAAASTSRSRASEVVFDFPAKSGQRRVQSIRDPDVAAAIEAMRRRRSGPDDLLAYREDGELARRPLRGRQRLHPGEDRRGVLGQGLPHLARHRARRGRAGAASRAPSSESGAERAIRAAVERVAEALGNTPAVCRRSYVDPRVLDRFRDGETIELPRGYGDGELSQRRRSGIERRVLELIAQ